MLIRVASCLLFSALMSVVVLGRCASFLVIVFVIVLVMVVSVVVVVISVALLSACASFSACGGHSCSVFVLLRANLLVLSSSSSVVAFGERGSVIWW